MTPKIAVLAVFLSLSVLHAAEQPKSLSAEEREEVATAVISLQQAQIQLLQKQVELRNLQQNLSAVNDDYRALIARLQGEKAAEGCTLNIKGDWTGCPDDVATPEK